MGLEDAEGKQGVLDVAQQVGQPNGCHVHPRVVPVAMMIIVEVVPIE